MNNGGKLTFCIVDSNKTCIPSELNNLILDNVEKNWVLRIQTIRQELCKPEKKEQQIELDEEQEKNPCEIMLIHDIKEEDLKPGNMQMQK